MSSQLNVDTIVDKAGSGGTNVKIANNAVTVSEGGNATTNTVQGLAKAWVNIDGTGTIASRDSFNVSGLVDNGTGDYTINFSVSMSDTNYSPSGTTSVVNDGGSTPRSAIAECATLAAHQIRTIVSYHENTKLDSEIVSVQIFGDLA